MQRVADDAARLKIRALCLKKRSKAEDSKRQWEQAEALCLEHELKLCRSCLEVLPFTSFHKDRSCFCNLRDRCSRCFLSRQKVCRATPKKDRVETKKRAEILSRLNRDVAAKHAETYETEKRSIDVFLSNASHDVVVLQDGTRSDLCLRPIGETEDIWLPIQIKSTSAREPPYSFQKASGYSMPVFGITGTGLMFDITDTQVETKKLSSNKECIVTAALKDLLRSYFDRYKVAGELLSLQTLRLDCSASSQVELHLMQLSSLLVDMNEINWPAHRNSPVDRILRDGIRVQDKAAHVYKNSYRGRLCKKHAGKMIPYDSADCDMFVFSTVHEARREFHEWRIPAAWLKERGFLTIRVDSVVQCVGLVTQIALWLPTDVHVEVFGTPRSSTGHSTEEFWRMLKLPPEYEIPQLLCGRDPVI